MWCGLNYSGTRFLSTENKNYPGQFPDGFYLNPFPDRRMIKLLKFDNLCPPRHQDSKSRWNQTFSRMTTAITFSRQNDTDSRACTTWYWENLVFVVVLVLESKGHYLLNKIGVLVSFGGKSKLANTDICGWYTRYSASKIVRNCRINRRNERIERILRRKSFL